MSLILRSPELDTALQEWTVVIFESELYLQLDMSRLHRRDSKPRAIGQRPANMILMSILDGVPRAGLVLRMVKLPAMKSSPWDGGGQRGRLSIAFAGFEPKADFHPKWGELSILAEVTSAAQLVKLWANSQNWNPNWDPISADSLQTCHMKGGLSNTKKPVLQPRRIL
ncbi:hypothetical protein WISP_125528 [Willisornis vidua]|uniref:Uncharacterized protein n=1 Tax=Willisornis vidua TaxID=1566151 RepID=A0ABQ9CS72_9PASS|nr:hypothetical protein WISP_125528 [Willisornis vidua]